MLLDIREAIEGMELKQDVVKGNVLLLTKGSVLNSILKELLVKHGVWVVVVVRD